MITKMTVEEKAQEEVEECFCLQIFFLFVGQSKNEMLSRTRMRVRVQEACVKFK